MKSMLAAGLACSAALLAWPLVPQARMDAGQGAVVLELFTSQGCSSCPPADLLMGQLARDPGLLVISRPVTYWDRLGWTDTLARPENTALQQAYAQMSGRGSGVFTPQVVVNGNASAIGSDEPAIRRLVRAAIGRIAPAMAVTRAPDGGFGIGIAGKRVSDAEVVLIALDSNERVNIGRGENSGHSVIYTNVVRAENRLGSWIGGIRSIPVPAAALHVGQADRYAVIVRQPGGGPILAARMLPPIGG